MRTPDSRSLVIFGADVCQDEDSALLMRVLVGQAPRDTSPDDGHLIKLDRETGCDLAASGQAVLVSDLRHDDAKLLTGRALRAYSGASIQTAPASSSQNVEIWGKTRKG